jgi:hypothetical protein
MKIVFLNKHHHKNIDSIIRMCRKTNIELEFTDDFNRCTQNNYDILISNQNFFNPDLIPEKIKIIFGPQLWVIPTGDIIGKLNEKYSKRCVYNSLSTWVEKYVLNICSSMVIPISQFPYAVDTEKFSPSNEEKTLDCILYFKNRNPQILNIIKDILNTKKINHEIIIYGSYNEENYIRSLRKCKFMVVCGTHESQGFALQEAMACNVPLVVYDCKTVFDEYGTNIFSPVKHLDLVATSVPYWSEECGLKTTELTEVSLLIDEMLNKYQTFNPRKFILENLSEEKCMNKILDYFNFKI